MTPRGPDERAAVVGGVRPREDPPLNPGHRVVLIAWANIRAASVAEATLPRRNRAPTITGAPDGERTACRAFSPRTLEYPYAAPCVA